MSIVGTIDELVDQGTFGFIYDSTQPNFTATVKIVPRSSIDVVPEPSALGLTAFGVTGLAAVIWFKRRRSSPDFIAPS